MRRGKAAGLLAAAVLLWTLAGCGGGPEEGAAPENGPEETAAAGEASAPAGEASPPQADDDGAEGASLPVAELLAYFEGLPPEALGLEGETMEPYYVYHTPGTVLVDGEPCIRIYVYDREPPAETNALENAYLLNLDASRLFLLDPAAGAVREIPL